MEKITYCWTFVEWVACQGTIGPHIRALNQTVIQADVEGADHWSELRDDSLTKYELSIGENVHQITTILEAGALSIVPCLWSAEVLIAVALEVEPACTFFCVVDWSESQREWAERKRERKNTAWHPRTMHLCRGTAKWHFLPHATALFPSWWPVLKQTKSFPGFPFSALVLLSSHEVAPSLVELILKLCCSTVEYGRLVSP